MQANRDVKTTGFTLVELSLALVIIGLIVGGVLTGRSLIAAAKIRAQISQIEQFKTAVSAFQNKYDGIPGDLVLNKAKNLGFVTNGCDGVQGTRDGNELIDGWQGSPYYLDQFIGETGMFWEDLSASGLIKGAFPANGAVARDCLPYTDTTALSLSAGPYYVGNFIPSAAVGGGNFIYVYENNGTNYYGLSSVTGTYDGGEYRMLSSATLPVISAYDIDTKIDDGIPTTGTVTTNYLSYNTITDVNSAANDSATTCYNTSTATGIYSTAQNRGNGENCALSFQFP